MKKNTGKIKLNLKRGDQVQLIAGDDMGKTGKVLQLMPQRGRAIVEGLNMVKKHMKKTQDNPNGGIIEKEAAIDISNLKLVEA